MLNCSSVNRSPSTARLRSGAVFDAEIVSEWDGLVVLRISGPQAVEKFSGESGGHRWQRIPKNQRSDKTHSSTVTVAVFPERAATAISVRESDCEVTTCRGSGPGGQLRNKTDSAVQVKHRPSGLIVRCETERSQQQNKATAFALLSARLNARHQAAATEAQRTDRLRQIGSGERSDKIRTVQMQNGQVVNHVTGRKANVERYLKGDIWCIA